jgi:hypothetical protein
MKQARMPAVSVVFAPFPIAELTQAERAEQQSGKIRTLSDDKCLLPVQLDGTADDARLKAAHMAITMEMPQPFFDKRAKLDGKARKLHPHYDSKFQQELPKIGFAVTAVVGFAQLLPMDAQVDLQSLNVLDFWPTLVALGGAVVLTCRNLVLNKRYAETEKELTRECVAAEHTKKTVLKNIESLQQRNAAPMALTP